MKQLFYILLFLFVIHCKGLFAQDTLILHTGQKKIVTVTEINPVDIKYKRFGTEMPLYVLSIKEVFCIKYQNGIIDTITKTYQATKPLALKNQHLHIVDSRIFNAKGPLNDANLWALINNYPKRDVKDQLIVNYKELGHQNKIQTICFLTGIGTGYFGFYTTAGLASNNNGAAAVVGAVSFAAIGSSIYFLVKSKRKVKRTKKQIVDLYNNNLN